MSGIANHLFAILVRLDMFGLLLFGVLDSSFLDLPLGNDLLLVALTARRHKMLPVYAAMAAAGSMIGCWLIDVLARKGGEEGLKKIVSHRQLEYVKRRVRKSAPWALFFASVLPPPFPFTPFVAAAAAFQYPRKKLLGVVAISRLARFSVIGLLSIYFDQQILWLAKSPAVHTGMLVVVVICIVGSVLSVITWIKAGRKAPTAVAAK